MQLEQRQASCLNWHSGPWALIFETEYPTNAQLFEPNAVLSWIDVRIVQAQAPAIVSGIYNEFKRHF